MDGRMICCLQHGSFLKKRKMQALVKPWLGGRLHFACLYYTISGVGVNSLGRGVRCRYFGAKSCCATITFCRNSIRTNILYSSFTNRLLMSTGLLSPHLEPDFRLPNIPIPPLPKSREKVIAPQRLFGPKCVNRVRVGCRAPEVFTQP